jgi:hypothetical protein
MEKKDFAQEAAAALASQAGPSNTRPPAYQANDRTSIDTWEEDDLPITLEELRRPAPVKVARQHPLEAWQQAQDNSAQPPQEPPRDPFHIQFYRPRVRGRKCLWFLIGLVIVLLFLVIIIPVTIVETRKNLKTPALVMTVTTSQSSTASSSTTSPITPLTTTTFSITASTTVSTTLLSTVPTTVLSTSTQMSTSIQSTTQTQNITQITTVPATMVSTQPTTILQTATITTTTSSAALPTEVLNLCWSIITDVCLHNGELPDMSSDTGLYANCPLIFKYFYCTLLKNMELKPCTGMTEFCSLPGVTAGNPAFSSAAPTVSPSIDTVVVSIPNTTRTSVVVVTATS